MDTSVLTPPKTSVGLQTVTIHLQKDHWTYECDGKHKEGQPIIVVTDKPCVLTFADPSVFGTSCITLEANAGAFLYQQEVKKQTSFDVAVRVPIKPEGVPRIPMGG